MEQGLFMLLLFVFLYIFPITNLLCDNFVCNLKSAVAGKDFCVPCAVLYNTTASDRVLLQNFLSSLKHIFAKFDMSQNKERNRTQCATQHCVK